MIRSAISGISRFMRFSRSDPKAIFFSIFRISLSRCFRKGKTLFGPFFRPWTPSGLMYLKRKTKGLILLNNLSNSAFSQFSLLSKFVYLWKQRKGISRTMLHHIECSSDIERDICPILALMKCNIQQNLNRYLEICILGRLKVNGHDLKAE